MVIVSSPAHLSTTLERLSAGRLDGPSATSAVGRAVDRQVDERDGHDDGPRDGEPRRGSAFHRSPHHVEQGEDDDPEQVDGVPVRRARLDGWTAGTFLGSLPNDEAASNPEMTAFVTWMRRIAPGEDLDRFAVDSWVSGKAFFDTLEALPGPITRGAFLARLRDTETFAAGGMFGPIRLGAELTNGCVIGVRYDANAWHRLVPDSGFLC